MNAINYDRLMMQETARPGERRLLIHACCAPCSSACLERLKDYFDITALFYNPNIEDGEYVKRKDELVRFLRETGYARILDCEHDKELFYGAVKGLEREIGRAHV